MKITNEQIEQIADLVVDRVARKLSIIKQQDKQPNTEKSTNIVVGDWHGMAGEPEHFIFGKSLGWGPTRTGIDVYMSNKIYYDVEKQHIRVCGNNLTGHHTINGTEVLFRRGAKESEFFADLSVSDFIKMLDKALESYVHHYSAVKDRANKYRK